MKEELLDMLGEAFKETFEKLQDRPDQYVVVYKAQKDDSVIGYHADTFCTIVKDILRGKRYSGEDPYPQLTIIAENLGYAMKRPSYTEKFMPGFNIEDVYIDAVYLAEGTPKQSFQLKVINPVEDGTENN